MIYRLFAFLYLQYATAIDEKLQHLPSSLFNQQFHSIPKLGILFPIQFTDHFYFLDK